ncbi:MAG TPA: hypothetical protein VJB57_13045 [Dehalococcoidia bacterium]|nr:hypothetical protein [Dehalococcoidia bacterium]
MKRTHGIMRTGVLAIVAGAAICLASFGTSTSAAFAKPKPPDLPKPDEMVCIIVHTDGSMTFYTDGATRRVRLSNGWTKTLTCNGQTGEWE